MRRAAIAAPSCVRLDTSGRVRVSGSLHAADIRRSSPRSDVYTESTRLSFSVFGRSPRPSMFLGFMRLRATPSGWGRHVINARNEGSEVSSSPSYRLRLPDSVTKVATKCPQGVHPPEIRLSTATGAPGPRLRKTACGARLLHPAPTGHNRWAALRRQGSYGGLQPRLRRPLVIA